MKKFLLLLSLLWAMPSLPQLKDLVNFGGVSVVISLIGSVDYSHYIYKEYQRKEKTGKAKLRAVFGLGSNAIAFISSVLVIQQTIARQEACG